MSEVSSAKRHHLNVWMYLKDLLDLVPAGETDNTRPLTDVWTEQPGGSLFRKRCEPIAQRNPTTKPRESSEHAPPPSSPPSSIASNDQTTPPNPTLSRWCSLTKSASFNRNTVWKSAVRAFKSSAWQCVAPICFRHDARTPSADC